MKGLWWNLLIELGKERWVLLEDRFICLYQGIPCMYSITFQNAGERVLTRFLIVGSLRSEITELDGQWITRKKLIYIAYAPVTAYVAILNSMVITSTKDIQRSLCLADTGYLRLSEIHCKYSYRYFGLRRWITYQRRRASKSIFPVIPITWRTDSRLP